MGGWYYKFIFDWDGSVKQLPYVLGQQQFVSFEGQTDQDKPCEDTWQPDHPEITEALFLLNNPREKKNNDQVVNPQDQLQNTAHQEQMHESQASSRQIWQQKDAQ